MSESPPSSPAPRRGWLDAPRTLGWLVLVGAALLALRKPWALHTPQLWAEDGSIFLTQDEQLGLRAFFEPYNGYLHLLPRLIAWMASHTADVAWWPAIYNGLAFAINVALFARLASRRIELPGKAGLMLAFTLVAGTGEVLINVTNLQWVTAFFLVLQLFATPAASPAQRLGDVALLGVVGLNGPFAIVLLPVFAWRAWRARQADAWIACAVVGACALVQAGFLSRTALSLDGNTAAFHPLMFFSIIGSRLVTWPIFGPAAVRSWPQGLHAALGVIVIGPLVWRAIRANSHRPTRSLIAATFGLIALASLYRVRADTWERDDIVNGDRYFYIPRVLLAWLLIWECRAASRPIAWTARGLCGLGVAMHIPHFVIPAPPDYHWAKHCDPIRRGV
ncbi:MAG: hypothetical protein ABIQ12_03400, partial [Opitutaceae bacterium]